MSDTRVRMEHVERLRSLYEGWAKGDIWADRSIYDDHVVYLSQLNEPNSGPHYGIDAMTEYTRSFLESWDHWRAEALGFQPEGDSVIVRVRLTGTGRKSGVPVENEAFHVWSFRGERAIRFEVFASEAEALQAVGALGTAAP